MQDIIELQNKILELEGTITTTNTWLLLVTSIAIGLVVAYYIKSIDVTYYEKLYKDLDDRHNYLRNRYKTLLTAYDIQSRIPDKLKTKSPDYSASPKFDKEFISRLIRLCHPDKHNNSKTSTEVTQTLNTLKKDM